MATTRTIGPLHFEDLDPKRFEDLVRQLAYEFRPWRKLEATGRSGSDDGFDARGYEMVWTELSEPATEAGGEPADEAAASDRSSDRLWLIQCKREKNIGPKKLLTYLDEIVLTPEEQLFGLVFTAACDFSKKARDDFTAKCRAMELQEWHLWGKAELEDRLFRPENDHLLFAYFGVSLAIRRRSQRAELRSRLAMKRKANRLLKDSNYRALLLRSPDALSYPYFESQEAHRANPEWVVRTYRGLHTAGLQFLLQRHFAYLDDDGKSWDAAMCVNDALPHRHEDPWLENHQDDRRQLISQAWDAFPERNRAWLEIVGVVPFDQVLDIDELGDEHVEAPHVYAPFQATPFGRGPFAEFYARVETTESWGARSIGLSGLKEGRIQKFPAELRKPDQTK